MDISRAETYLIWYDSIPVCISSFLLASYFSPRLLLTYDNRTKKEKESTRTLDKYYPRTPPPSTTLMSPSPLPFLLLYPSRYLTPDWSKENKEKIEVVMIMCACLRRVARKWANRNNNRIPRIAPNVSTWKKSRPGKNSQDPFDVW